MTDSAAASAVPTDLSGVEPGFADPVRGAQSCFRAVLEAMAHPGRIVKPVAPLASRSPAPLGAGAAAVALTLCDIDTPVWLDPALAPAERYLAFHCGAPLVSSPGEARFAFVADLATLPPLESFALGTDEYPERSTTLAIEVAKLSDAGGLTLRGPGIRGETRLDIDGLPPRFWEERAALAELFPRGIDLLFVSGDKLAAVSRSTRVTS